MKKTTLRNLAGMLFLLLATAGSSFSQVRTAISISGTVSYIGSNAPAANKLVTIVIDSTTRPISNPVVTVTTNAQGFFMDSLILRDSGMTFINVYTMDCNNFMVSRFGMSVGGSNIVNADLRICQTAQTITISGNVVDGRTTTPMANQVVSIEPDSSLWSAGFYFPTVSATTNSSGVFTATVPHPGNNYNSEYVVKALACGATYSTSVSSTGGAAQTSLTVCSNVSATTNLSGNVWLGSNIPAANCYVAAYQVGAAFSTITYSLQGDFSFQNLPSGQYIVVAWLSPSNPVFNAYFPTYGYSASSWTNATLFGPNNNQFTSITLIPTDSAIGGGTVGGTVGGDSSVNANLRTSANYTMPLLYSQARIIISNATTNVDRYFAQVNSNGSYTLPNLPFGTYKIRLEYAKMTSPMGTITISPTAPSVNVNFNVSGGTVTTSIRRSMNNAALSVYPNPAQDVVTVNWQSAEIKSVKVISTLGSQVQAPVSIENGKAQISVAGLKAGIYTVIAEGQNGEFLSQTVVKQ